MRSFRDRERVGLLARAKAREGLTLSVCIPARDEEETIGEIVATVRARLVDDVELVDEILVLDDGSVDATATAAAHAGARVCAVDEVLPALARGSGKGNALWKALFVAEGDLICYLDGDVRNFEPHFVSRLAAPLIAQPEISMVKSYYRRPLYGEPTGGGRVTELMARPLLSRLFPELAHFVQPLSGEYAGRRTVLEAVPFVQGWGVEIGLLIDVAAQFGVASIAQADLGVREHRNRPLDDLGAQAMAILVTGLRRAGLDADSATATAQLFRFDAALERESVPVEASERPPMISVPAYRAKFGRELTA